MNPLKILTPTLFVLFFVFIFSLNHRQALFWYKCATEKVAVICLTFILTLLIDKKIKYIINATKKS